MRSKPLGDDLPGAGLRLFQRALDIHPGGYLLAWSIFEKFGGHADHNLVRLMKGGPVLVLELVIDLNTRRSSQCPVPGLEL